MKVQLFHRSESIEIEVDGAGETRQIRGGDGPGEASAIALSPSGGTIRLDGRPVRFLFERRGTRVRVAIAGECHEFDLTGQPKGRRSASIHGNPETRAPMPGKVLQVSAEPGAAVKPGDPLLILEAMKMENVLSAEITGTVKEVRVKAGDMVDPGMLLVLIEPDAPPK